MGGETVLAALLTGFLQLGVVLLGSYLTVYLDRQLRARAAGETSALLDGLKDPLFDSLAILARPKITLARADHLLWFSAPVVAFVSVFIVFSVVPWGPRLSGRDLNVGLFFFLALIGPVVVAVMNAAWGQNSKHGVISAYRAGANLFSYEITGPQHQG